MHLWIQYMMTEVCSAGFPHSEIAGSQDICSSPALIAAYHVFHRLSVPRHPPCALCSMTTSLYSVTTMGRSFSIRKKCVCKKSILYGLMSYHFQYVVFKVHAIKKLFFKLPVALENLRFSHSRAFCKCRQCPAPVITSKLVNRFVPLSALSKSFRGDNEIRTRDLLLARQALSQLSYTPINLASTYSPVPSPAKYHRPSVS